MKKIPTLYLRDEHNRRYVTDQVNPAAAWVFTSPTVVATRKWDGACVLLRDVDDPDEWWWTRREVKRGGAFPYRFWAVDHDVVTGTWIGWEPARQGSWWKLLAEFRVGDYTPGTYELCGPKVNGNPEDLPHHMLLRHGADLAVQEPTNRAAYVDWLSGNPAEGIVFWERYNDPTGRMAKIKARDLPELAS